MPIKDDASRKSKSDADARPQPQSKRDADPTRPAARHVSQDPQIHDSSTEDLAKRHVTLVLPEMQRRSSHSRSPSVPYPSFSKQHSREAVRSLDSVSPSNPSTPQTTDVSDSRASKISKSSSSSVRDASAQYATSSPSRRRAQAPPSPPLTAMGQPDLRRAGSGNSMKQAAIDAREQHARRKSADNDTLSSLRQAEEGSGGLKAASARPSASSKSSLRSLFQGRSGMASGKKSPLAKSADKQPQSPTASEVTPIRERRATRSTRLDCADDRFGSDAGSPRRSRENIATSARTTPRPNDGRITPVPSLEPHSIPVAPTAAVPPPPPPPPPNMPTEAPRVDYLLQNGGLPATVPKNFTSAFSSIQPQSYQQYMSPKPSPADHHDLSAAFEPFSRLLEDYASVVARNGSLAVATGYKSVARRLLDRLENVFSRNISSETCRCLLCADVWGSNAEHDEDTGVSWGEILELVSGRRELPPWPPFSLSAVGVPGLGIIASGHHVPMQKLDIDVPDEYREHYIRQSKKTKQAVDKWLAGQPEDQPPSPHEVDDGTMIFAMLTYLEPDQRRGFTALLRGLSAVPNSRAATPAQGLGPKSDLLTRTGLALQRLYRLARPPRDPECAMFLSKHKNLHSVLATLAAISQQEWDILISGRFDGFLWSGAEDSPAQLESRPADEPRRSIDNPPERGLSQGKKLTSATPGGSISSGGAGPVQLDEETEIAVLSEVEREIYLGMEALEDAFEVLHGKAEKVRNALLQRSAGLAMQAQRRKGHDERDSPQVRLGTPAAGLDQLRGRRQVADRLHDNGLITSDEEDDGGMLDGRSELAPDDSASNVGWREREKRNQRYKKRSSRRNERRTPAPVEEEDEDTPLARTRR